MHVVHFYLDRARSMMHNRFRVPLFLLRACNYTAHTRRA
jgi:hypothetical protein